MKSYLMKLSRRVTRWLNLRQPSQTLVLGGAAVLVGLLAGAGVWLFKQMITWTNQVMFGELGARLGQYFGGWTVVFVPLLGGLLVGWLVFRFIGEERHHGVAGIMEATALAGGRLRFRRMPVKTIAAALSIGSGASVGPEDPSVQIGANLGSMFGQLLNLSEDWVRALVAAGAAAGISAAFNAPIAGIFFALEIILGEFSSSAFSVVVLASVISAVFTQTVSGPEPAFHVPAYAFNSAWELPLYLGLGLLAGPLAAGYISLLDRTKNWFGERNLPRWLKPALAGAVVGAVGIFLPQVFGVGYTTIDAILAGRPPQSLLLLALLAAKLILTPISIGGGFPGGVFAPALFLGATLGGLYGNLADRIFPGLSADPAAFALVGMAAVLAGAVRAPLTAILLLFEMTNDYRIILPLMFAVVISLLSARRLQPESVYTLPLLRKGIRLEHGMDIEVLDHIRVDEVMQTGTPVLNEDDPLSRAIEQLSATREHGLPVANRAGDLVGILTEQDIERYQNGQEDPPMVGDLCTRDLLVTYPDESIRAALLRMGTRDVGRLPVVDRDHPRALVGMLRRPELISAYNLALVRRASVRHRAEEVRLGAVSHMDVQEVAIRRGAACDGKRVKDVRWPQDCVIASVRRGRNIFIPHGNTLLMHGDILVALAKGSAGEELRRLCNLTEPGEETGG